MISIHTLELSIQLNPKRFNDLKSRAYKMAKGDHRFGPKKNDPDVHVDDALADDGIMVEYHDQRYRKTIKLRVNPSEVLGGDDLDLWKPSKKNTKRLLELLESHIDDYFDSDYCLNDLSLSRIEFTSNLHVGRKKVPEYIKLLHRIGKVSGYSPKYAKADYSLGGIKKECSFDLVAKKHGIEFTAYDKEADLRSRGKEGRAERAKGILRIEVRLKKPKAVENVLAVFPDWQEMSTSSRIMVMAQNCADIFMEQFVKIVPYGVFCRLKDAEEQVASSGLNKSRTEKMLRLLRLIPEKKSLYLALKGLDTRNPSKVLKWFAELNISPVTIGQRGKFDSLENLYDFL